MLPEAVKKGVQNTLNIEIATVTAVSGGSINQAAKIGTTDGDKFFLKWNPSAPADMFPKEKKGLELLASVNAALTVPDVIEISTSDAEVPFLLIEYIAQGQGSTANAEQFGRALAALHQTTASTYGLSYDNYIGRLVQSNTTRTNWLDFFVEQRLEVQLRAAVDEGKLDHTVAKQFQQLYKQLPDIIPNEPASLLHGDLWGGNYFFDQSGQAAIFDPAVYYGSREIEIAFTYLFGGFTPAFYDAYEQMFPLKPHFKERRDIYNLYPLLVHTNMFGGHYSRQVAQIVGGYA